MKILSEIGSDLSRFANVKHCCSWLGLCPATKISGGKVISARTKRSANRVRQALKMAAMSLSTQQFGPRGVLPKALPSPGQAAGQYRYSTQIGKDSVFHADPG